MIPLRPQTSSYDDHGGYFWRGIMIRPLLPNCRTAVFRIRHILELGLNCSVHGRVAMCILYWDLMDRLQSKTEERQP